MSGGSSEAWKKMVLRSMQPPAWLAEDAIDSDVVISSRYRVARNVVGYFYPHRAENADLVELSGKVRAVADGLALSAQMNISEAERDYLLGSRLISPEFEHSKPGRMVLLDRDRRVSIMVNEEDHLRIQVVSAGWSIREAVREGRAALEGLGKGLDFQSHPDFGFLTASPTNLGGGMRRSALFHLVGLGTQGRLNRMIQSLHHMGVTTRGLFGESSRGIASFVQVSGTTISDSEFTGACNYLIGEERLAREGVAEDLIREKAESAAEFAVMSSQLSMRDALLVLGYARWAAAMDLSGFRIGHRTVDAWVTEMEVFGTQSATVAARQRADSLRSKLENLG